MNVILELNSLLVLSHNTGVSNYRAIEKVAPNRERTHYPKGLIRTNILYDATVCNYSVRSSITVISGVLCRISDRSPSSSAFKSCISNVRTVQTILNALMESFSMLW